MNFWGLGQYAFFVGLGSLLLGYKHYLPLLLSLEMMMLSLYLIFCDFIGLWQVRGGSILLFLTMIVCEGAFGLCILVSFSRSYGRDRIYLMSI